MCDEFDVTKVRNALTVTNDSDCRIGVVASVIAGGGETRPATESPDGD